MLTVRGRGAGACAVFLSTVVSRVVSRHEGPLYVLSCVRQCVCGPCRQCAVPHGACRSARLGAREQFHNFHCFHMHVSCARSVHSLTPTPARAPGRPPRTGTAPAARTVVRGAAPSAHGSFTWAAHSTASPHTPPSSPSPPQAAACASGAPACPPPRRSSRLSLAVTAAAARARSSRCGS